MSGVQITVAKRFWPFIGDAYYAGGGMHDLGGQFDTAEEAFALAGSRNGKGWWHVLDIESNTVIAASETQGQGADPVKALPADSGYFVSKNINSLL